ncbi:hypothetical protein [Acidithiobacillus caldus]|nr:hypothetical protein [Acidithiobacillus caldus]
MTDPLLRQDLQKLLAALADGPKTQAELVAHRHLRSPSTPQEDTP